MLTCLFYNKSELGRGKRSNLKDCTRIMLASWNSGHISSRNIQILANLRCSPSLVEIKPVLNDSFVCPSNRGRYASVQMSGRLADRFYTQLPVYRRSRFSHFWAFDLVMVQFLRPCPRIMDVISWWKAEHQRNRTSEFSVFLKTTNE